MGTVIAAESVWVTLAPYVVAIVSVVGTAVVAGLASRQSHAAWLREQRLRAYSSFLDQAVLVSVAAQDQVSATGEAERAEAAGRFDGAGTILDQAMSVVLILGPPPVAEAARGLFDAEVALGEAGDTDAALTAAMREVVLAHRGFVAAAGTAMSRQARSLRRP